MLNNSFSNNTIKNLLKSLALARDKEKDNVIQRIITTVNTENIISNIRIEDKIFQLLFYSNKYSNLDEMEFLEESDINPIMVHLLNRFFKTKKSRKTGCRIR